MNKFELERNKAFKLAGQLKQSGIANRQAQTPAIDRREQRKQDQAAGLVPFPLKLSQTQADRLRALALERGISTNEIVAELLQKALDA
jgi:hypothetical protein